MFTESGVQPRRTFTLPMYTFGSSCYPTSSELCPRLTTPIRIPGVYATSTPMATSTVSVNPGRARRGRRSTIPPEQREKTRRIHFPWKWKHMHSELSLCFFEVSKQSIFANTGFIVPPCPYPFQQLKKQDMERRRRACISDKMNALHNLAMNIIGLDAHQQQKQEKADILNTCYKVFEAIAQIVHEEPELQTRIHQLRSICNAPEPSAGTSLPPDENTQSSAFSDDLQSSDSEHSYPASRTSEMKENRSQSPSFGYQSTHSRKPLTEVHMNIRNETNSSCNTCTDGSRLYDSGICNSFGENISVPGSSTHHQATHKFNPKTDMSRKPRISLEKPPLQHLSPCTELKFTGSQVTPSNSSAFRVVQGADIKPVSNSVWRPYL
ncbi:Helix-loop-helix DNA-binding domain protein [Opisthorchis viverrini]|uniref:Helix-loop-helix DNA-binding domain protein n=1 Tax=Opisthorchis viverrini TaxID=6198 RepID=A0A1S8X7J9_OPIVI|nr:Helix-loop-helix DNA-binding domain protein [Opisthorchis viverrini]